MKAASKSLRAFIWPGLTGLAALLCLILIVVLLAGGSERAKRAYDEGRSMAISLQTGDIDGLPLRTEQELPAPEPASQALPAAAPAAEQPRMDSGLPGKFSSGDPAAAQTSDTVTPPSPEQPASANAQPAHHQYPEAVKQEPETRKTAESAPVEPVESAELTTGQPAPTATADAPPALYPVGKPMAIAPNPELVEKSPMGELPVVSKEGVRPADYYAKPLELPATESVTKTPMVAIVLTGLGLGRYTTEDAMKLPAEITFSLSPYGQDGLLWSKHARDHGHEILVDLPMHPVDYPATDPGPFALMNTLKVEENTRRLHQIMGRFPGYVGFLAPAKATTPELAVLQAMREIGQRGLLLVDQPGKGADALQSRKKELGLVDISATVIVDEHLNDTAIQNALQALVETAKAQGQVIAVARPYPITLKHLRQWAPELANQGVMLVPVSAIAARMK